ncbi:MAG: ATP-binding protein, partial [Gammaproteobacteria bacterium]|nr:ATP-binding protein [Gammaproteobacteria bacterium]
KLLITHGLSGSGKSHLTAQLPALMPLVRIRSDVERKRLAGLAPQQAGDAALYAPAMTERTYSHLAEAARAILASGRPALIDATFLQQAQRQRFRQLAEGLGVEFVILDFDLPQAELERRISQRSAAREDASDADLAVLQQQIRHAEPLSAEELAQCLRLEQHQADAHKLQQLLGARDG